MYIKDTHGNGLGILGVTRFSPLRQNRCHHRSRWKAFRCESPGIPDRHGGKDTWTGPAVQLTLPEIAVDVLAINLGELLGSLEGFLESNETIGFLVALLGLSDMISDRNHMIVNEALHVDLGPGYWITVILLGCMLLAETALVLKNRVTIPTADFLRVARARVAPGT